MLSCKDYDMNEQQKPRAHRAERMKDKSQASRAESVNLTSGGGGGACCTEGRLIPRPILDCETEGTLCLKVTFGPVPEKA